MKKLAILLLITLMATLTITATKSGENTEYLRIHIRANSNAYQDQAVKYQIKEEVVSYLIPFILECNTKQKAVEVLESQKQNINAVVKEVLVKNGFSYACNTTIRNELFPTRVYDDFTLEEGFYDAVIIELGDASGDNWWCVVYPPLCFQGTEKLTYKSKIVEIINEFRAKYIKEKV